MENSLRNGNKDLEILTSEQIEDKAEDIVYDMLDEGKIKSSEFEEELEKIKKKMEQKNEENKKFNKQTQSNPDSDDDNLGFDKIQSQDQEETYPKVKIEAEMKDSEDFPGLKYHSSVMIENNIVLFGGKDSDYEDNNVLNIYDLEEKAWLQKELKGESNQIPEPRTYHTAVAIGITIYITGGDVKGEKDKNVYQIDFDTQKCQIIGEVIDPVSDHTADIYNQCIYIFGGQSLESNEFTAKLQKFDLLTNECEETKPIGYQPERRVGHRSIIVQDHLYVFGGWQGNNDLQDMFSVDLSNNVFTEINQRGLIPSPRSDFSFFAFEDKLYLFGGESNDVYCSDFYAFDLKSLSWKPQEVKNQECLLKRAYHSTVAVVESSHKLQVYLVGGMENWDSIYKNMNVFTLTSYRLYWILHFLESTNIHYLPGLNLVQEIIELFE